MNTIFNSIRRLGFRRGPRRLFGGIAGGIADRFGLSVWVTRILVLIAMLLPVVGVGLYVLIWLLTPWQDDSIPLERLLSKRS